MIDNCYYIEIKAFRPSTGTIVTEWVKVFTTEPNGKMCDLNHCIQSIVGTVMQENGPDWGASATVKDYSEFEQFLQNNS
jgi:hypothetical protein